MSRDTHLINIYLKIHQKRPLTMGDLRYLAKYDPECFEKTCKNVVYNVPEAKPVMEPFVTKEAETEMAVEAEIKPKDITSQSIEQILENLKLLEVKNLPVADVDVEKVKNLLGNLYMELMFPHNDKDTFLNMPLSEQKSKFDKKA